MVGKVIMKMKNMARFISLNHDHSSKEARTYVKYYISYL